MMEVALRFNQFAPLFEVDLGFVSGCHSFGSVFVLVDLFRGQDVVG